MKRGDIFEARLDPTEGSEQAGSAEALREIERALLITLNLPGQNLR